MSFFSQKIKQVHNSVKLHYLVLLKCIKKELFKRKARKNIIMLKIS